MGFFDLFRQRGSSLIDMSLTSMREMLETDLRMFRDSTGYLLENEILNTDLEELDAGVNAREIEIRRAVLEHFAINPDDEMVFGLILISIVQDAERLGDLAKSIAEMARMTDVKRFGPEVDELRAIRDEVVKMYTDTIQGFTDGDEELTLGVMVTNQQQKARREGLIKRLVDNKEIDQSLAVVLAVSTRMISRTASHLSNIASAIALPFDQLRQRPNR